MSTHMLGILADDLTGAIDTIGTFAAAGLDTFVSISAAPRADAPSPEVLCVNTQTRNVDGPEAARTVRSATRLLFGRGYPRMYKKIDSTLRGHLGLEVSAMLDESEAPCAFVVPVFPDAGRTQRQGVLYVDRIPLLQAQEGEDAIAGAPSSSVVNVLEQQAGRRVGLATLSSVEGGGEQIERRVRTLLDDGYSIVALDAASNDHLRLIDAVLALRFPEGLLVGSAGLASAMAERIGPNGPGPPRRRATTADGQLLIVSGSLNRVTVKQLERLRRVPGIRAIAMDTHSVLRSRSASRLERERLRSAVRTALENGEDPCLTWDSGPPGQGEDTPTEFLRRSRRLNEFLAGLMPRLLQGAEVKALVFVGGDTAYSVLTGLQSDGIEMDTELLPGISLGTVVGGYADSKPLVTKAGGFGDDYALMMVVEYLRLGRWRERGQLPEPAQ